jgi:hypothetical protein
VCFTSFHIPLCSVYRDFSAYIHCGHITPTSITESVTRNSSWCTHFCVYNGVIFTVDFVLSWATCQFALNIHRCISAYLFYSLCCCYTYICYGLSLAMCVTHRPLLRIWLLHACFHTSLAFVLTSYSHKPISARTNNVSSSSTSQPYLIRCNVVKLSELHKYFSYLQLNRITSR